MLQFRQLGFEREDVNIPRGRTRGKRGFCAFLELLTPHGKLDTLYMHSCTCGREGVSDLAKRLQHYPDIVGVSLPCVIDAAAAKLLANALERMRDLVVLAITASDLGESSTAAPALALWPHVARLTELTFLFLAGGMRVEDVAFGSLTRLQVRSI